MPKNLYKVSLYHRRLDATGRDLIRETLTRTNWNVSATARLLGIHRSSLVSTMRRLEIREGQSSPATMRESRVALAFVWLVLRQPGHSAWCEGQTSDDAVRAIRDPRLLAMCHDEGRARSLVVRINTAAALVVPHSNFVPTEPVRATEGTAHTAWPLDSCAVLRSSVYAAS